MKANLLYILISSFFLLCSCAEDTDFVPFQYKFFKFEFIDTIKAVNYKGEYISSNREFNQEDFLFSKNLGFEPADEIRINSKSTATFIYTSERYGYLELAATYSKDQSKIRFHIEPLNDTSDSLYLTFVDENNSLKVTAFGVIKYLYRDYGLIGSSFRTYDLYYESLYSDMISTDTLFIQEFVSIYESKGADL